MTINKYIEPYDNKNHQDLWNDLMIQAIQQLGEEVQYLPRHLQNYDQLLGADDSSSFDNAWTVEMQVITSYGFGGDKEFYSKFGEQVRDEVVLAVNRERWTTEVGKYASQSVPNEGDMLFVKRWNKMFVIKFVDPREMFYQHGALYTWELTCEVFEYSGETIDTGDQDIDDISLISTNDVNWALTDENGNILTDEEGNILTVDGFSIGAVDPGSQNDYLPGEVLEEANVNITTIDPFDFLQSQSRP